MIQSKIEIVGHVVRIRGNKLYVQTGGKLDVYNSDYYRVVEGR